MHATEMKTKRHYTSPVTLRATVELEGGFCGSVIKDNTAGYATVISTPQEFEEINANAWGVDGKTEDNSSIIQW